MRLSTRPGSNGLFLCPFASSLFFFPSLSPVLSLLHLYLVSLAVLFSPFFLIFLLLSFLLSPFHCITVCLFSAVHIFSVSRLWISVSLFHFLLLSFSIFMSLFLSF